MGKSHRCEDVPHFLQERHESQERHGQPHPKSHGG